VGSVARLSLEDCRESGVLDSVKKQLGVGKE